MRSWKVCVTLFLICSAGIASESRLPFGTVFKGQDQFNRLVAKAKAENWKSLPIGDRTAAVGKALVGTRYKHFTLEIDNRIESPSVNFNGMDCWTFFETALGFARMLNEPESNWTPERLLHYIEMDRYRGGQCTGDYLSRLHYLEDWLYDNDRRGLVNDMTRQLGGRSVPHSAREMSVGWRHYRYLASNRSLLGPLARMEANVSSRPLYEIPKSQVARIEPKLQQRRRHWCHFARAKRAPFDGARGAGTAHERRRFAFHARFVTEQFRQSCRGRSALEISVSVRVRQRNPRRAASAIRPIIFLSAIESCADGRQNENGKMKRAKLLASISLYFATTAYCFGETKIRVGHFPNITHAQGVVAHALSRQGKGWFEQRLGSDVKIEWFIYNAGPSAMEAIFAKSIDLTYVGPGPALNAYTKSNGQEIRLIAGAANGGAGLVVQANENLKAPADFRGKKIATPQLGNTQDISCRAWLTEGGLKITQLGGDAQVIPTQNPDQLSLFKARKIDGVWTVEPWLSRLEQEASGKVIVEEKDSPTTVLVSSAKFLNQQRELAKKFASAHAELTEWITKNPEEAQRLIKAELLTETKSDMSPQLIDAAWNRIVFTAVTPRAAVEKFVQNSVRAGFIKTAPDLSKLFENP